MSTLDRAFESMQSELHVFVLRPLRKGMTPGRYDPWAPWVCICGASGTGGNDDLALEAFNDHV